MVKSTCRLANFFEFRRPPLLFWLSMVGIRDKGCISLDSALIANAIGAVADLESDAGRLGARDMLRRSRALSSVNCRVKVRGSLAGTARLVAAPGLDGAIAVDPGGRALGGALTIGPPSLRLMVSH